MLTGVIAAALAMAATAGTDLLLTQRLQLVLGLTPLHAGLIVTAFAAGSLPVSVLAGGLLHRTGARPLIGGGLLLGALGVLVTLLLTPGAGPLLGGGRSPAWMAPGLVLAGAGLGIVMVAASAAIIGGAPPQCAGTASSIESACYELGSLAGVTILGTILTAVYTGTIRLPAIAPAGVIFFAAFAQRQRIEAVPLIKPSLLRNRGFTAGLILGLVFFATVAGLLYAVSLFLQRGAGYSPERAAVTGFAPAAVGSVAVLATIVAHSGTAVSAAELAPAMTLSLFGAGTWPSASAVWLLDESDLAITLLQDAMHRLPAPAVRGTSGGSLPVSCEPAALGVRALPSPRQ